MVRFLCELISNRCFTLQTSDGRLSCPHPLKHGVSQGSTLSPLLFNICISDLPCTQSQQCGYTDDLALLYVDKDWKKIEKTPESDMMNTSTYLDKWKLKLCTAKTTTAFHLNDREANRQLKIFVRRLLLPHQSHPTYLGVKLDRQLTYRQHLEGLRSKVSARNTMCIITGWLQPTPTECLPVLAGKPPPSWYR